MRSKVEILIKISPLTLLFNSWLACISKKVELHKFIVKLGLFHLIHLELLLFPCDLVCQLSPFTPLLFSSCFVFTALDLCSCCLLQLRRMLNYHMLSIQKPSLFLCPCTVFFQVVYTYAWNAVCWGLFSWWSCSFEKGCFQKQWGGEMRHASSIP